jgi:hypothetical protein
VIKLIREGTTGGLANVLHRENIKGKTKINHWRIKDGIIYSENSDYVMTNGLVWDFNSLYPATSCSKVNELIKYTNNRMYMPLRLAYYTKNKDDIMRIINDRNNDKLFIVELKGGIYDENGINKCINFPPIFRNIHVKPTANVVGEIMSNQYMKVNKFSNLEKVKPEKKLTQLLSTMGEYMVFST